MSTTALIPPGLTPRVFTRALGNAATALGTVLAAVVTVDDTVSVTSPPESAVVAESDPEAVIPLEVSEEEASSVPQVTYEDIGGLTEEVKKIREMVELPLKHPEIFDKLGIEPPKGVLLHGPPGTGKTMLAKAVATEAEANFISIKGSELLHRYVGESARLTRELFRRARISAPCVIFIDEIDTVGRARTTDNPSVIHEDIVNGLLIEMDGLTDLKSILVLAATNRPEMLDPALLRPGRFDKIIEIPPPDEKTREEIFKIHAKKMPLLKGVSFGDLAAKTEGYTGADIENACREAGMVAIRKEAEGVSTADFDEALTHIKPSISKEYVERIKRFAKGSHDSMFR